LKPLGAMQQEQEVKLISFMSSLLPTVVKAIEVDDEGEYCVNWRSVEAEMKKKREGRKSREPFDWDVFDEAMGDTCEGVLGEYLAKKERQRGRVPSPDENS
jgi:hypothetical protein